MKIIIATIKSWNVKNADKFRRDNDYEHGVFIITNKDDLTYEKVSEINPEYIFFPHWSWIIPKEIYETFNCIVFHMTDLPFGRGGSPLQNLIERGIENTKISAIKVDEGIDTGDIYFKESLNLNGTADEIFIRASQIIFNKMIPKIINEKILPKNIRMLDGEEYPRAFIKFGKYKLEFSRASLKNNKIIADVEIMDEDD